jgi:hypothetical protein
LKQKDGVGARREIVQDLLEVGSHLARLSGTQPFDPAMLLDENLPLRPYQTSLPLDRSLDEVLLSKDLQQILGEDLADRLYRQGVVFRKIGTGELYFIALNQQGILNHKDDYLP